MATSASLLLLLPLLLSQPWLGAGADTQAVVCAGTACYSAHWGKLTAAEAQLLCNKDGGNLATVRTEEEARHIQKALAQLLQPGVPWTGKFWIGLQREKGRCLNPDLPLRGFSWVGGGEDSLYSNWYKEPRTTCISNRCASLMLDPSLSSLSGHLPKWSEGPCGNPGSPVSNIEGFVCKFSFKGMCRPLALGGPGQVNYSTPFKATSSSLEAVPFASVANVACGAGGEGRQYFFLCKEKATDVFDWGISGPLCASAEYKCSFNNGGCQQECFDGEDGSFRCGCRPGFRLLDDLVTCVSRDPCSSSPCRGVATCVPDSLWKNYTCQCPEGYQLNATQRDCVDVDECQASPCEQECVNTPGSFHCQCWVGYEPGGPREKACRDVDECTSPEGGLCEGYCLNTEGSFHCTCLPGSELAPDGVSCIPGPTSLEPSAETSQGQNTGDREGSLMPSTTALSLIGGPEDTSKVAPTRWRPVLESSASIAPTSPQSLTTSGTPEIWMEHSSHHPTATTGHEESTDGDLIAQPRNDGPDWQKLLLFYILGTVAAILLLLALALGLLVYRKRRAKREEKEKKPQSAADSYSWVPERAESRAMENQYSPTPGTDC